jgi:hypothetical protein
MDTSKTTSQLIAQLCHQLDISEFPRIPKLSTDASMTISAKAWKKFQLFKKQNMLQRVFMKNELVTNIGVLVGQRSKSDTLIVEDYQMLNSNCKNQNDEYPIQLLAANILNSERKNIVGWCIFTTGTGVSVPSMEIERLRQHVQTLNIFSSALNFVIVVDVMKASSDEDEAAHLECYDLSDLMNSENGNVSSVAAMQWTVDD